MITSDEEGLKEIMLNQIEEYKEDNILINLINEYLIFNFNFSKENNDFLEKCQTDTLIFNFLAFVQRKKIEIKKYLALDLKIFEIIQPKLRIMELSLRQFNEIYYIKMNNLKSSNMNLLKIQDFPIFLKSILSVFNFSYFNFFKTAIMQDLLKVDQLKELTSLFHFTKKIKDSKLIHEIEDKIPEFLSIMYSIENIAFREEDEDEDQDLVDN